MELRGPILPLHDRGTPRALLAGMRVLIIDDDATIGCVLRRALSGTCRVVVEQTTRAAIDRLQRGEWYDAVVCDVHMPDGGGRRVLDVVQSLRDRPAFVLMSGEAEVQESRADAVLCKPFRAQDLREVLATLAATRGSAVTQPIGRLAG